MDKHYWLHRISHEWELSYSLLDAGWLSIGWSGFIGTDILDRIREEGEAGFTDAMNQAGVTGRARWSLWYFANFRPGDIVVVPLFDRSFTVVEVEEEARSAVDLCGQTFADQHGSAVEARADGFWSSEGFYEIGFVMKVKKLLPAPIPRSFAEAPLVSKMKLRQTNADISGIAGSVEAAIRAKGPVDLHDVLSEAAADGIRQALDRYVSPDQLERLVRWYMEKKGASHAWIPAKNERGKDNGADADVIAEFEDLRVIFYIQVKKHEGRTGDWAVHQITEYASQKQDDANDYTYIPWVISTADFSDPTIQEAKVKGVRLIGGKDFVRMILDCGLDGIGAVL